MGNAIKFFSLLGATILLLFVSRWTNLLVFDGRQILSISIFSMFIYGTLLFGEFRLAFAFSGIALLMMVGAPLLLGSVYGLIIALIGLVMVMARIGGEEKMLAEELEGYEEYRQKVHYRLIPLVW